MLSHVCCLDLWAGGYLVWFFPRSWIIFMCLFLPLLFFFFFLTIAKFII